MSIKLSFGKYKGQTLEWLFFNAPSYAEFIYNEGIHRQAWQFSEAEGDEFEKLFTRASCLRGICPYCKERQIKYLGMSHLRSGALGHVDFFCDECDYTGGSATGYIPPSFFIPYIARRGDQLRLPKLVKSRFIGYGRLTQEKMEAFFHNDAHFAHATPGFFTRQPAVA